MSKSSEPINAGMEKVAPYEIKKDEEYMSEEMKEHFRTILEQRRQTLMEAVDDTVGHLKADHDKCPDPLDEANQAEGFRLELRTRDRERQLLRKIEESLDSLENGEYGFCEDCGAEIGLRRLEARPTANKCIDCKTFEEIREKQSGS